MAVRKEMLKKLHERLGIFQRQRFVFKSLGINLMATARDKTLENPLRYTVILIGAIVTILTQFAYSLKHIKEIEKATVALSFSVPSVNIVLKSFLYLYLRPRLIKQKERGQKMAKSVNSSEHEKLLAIYMQEELLTLGYYIISWGVVFAMYLRPFLALWSRYVGHHRETIIEPALQGLYPFDISRMEFYTITLLLNFLLLFFMINTEVGVDCTFSWFVHNISANFSLLKLRLKRLASDYENANAEEIANQPRILDGKLTKIIDYHCQILDYAKDFDADFRMLMLMQMLFSAFDICFFLFLIRLANDLSNFLFLGLSTISLIAQVMFYCFGGQWIQNQSQDIADVIYLEFPWHCLHSKVARSLLLPLQRAQKPTLLTGYFFIADNEMFVAVLKTAVSFVAVFKAIAD